MEHFWDDGEFVGDEVTTDIAGRKNSLSERTAIPAHEVLAGRRRSLRGYMAFAGPAVVASIAYMDPGNFATNIQAGARYGYGLLWVVLLANLIAMLFQALSAKLGIADRTQSRRSCAATTFRRRSSGQCGRVSEIAAMATDLAEFLGGAIGLSLLFGMPLLAGMLVTGVIVYGILMFERLGFRPVELIIGNLVALIAFCYLVEMLIAPVDWRLAAHPYGAAGTARRPGPAALRRHHWGNGHAPCRLPAFRADAGADTKPPRWRQTQLVRISNVEVIVALAIAGLVNMSMVMMASGAFHLGHSEVAEIESAYYTLAPLLGSAAAGIFLLSLLASGVSSSTVGTMAGQVIMQGFVGFRIPIWVRRLVTMIPAFVIVGLGVNATQALVISQVVLSIALPLPMIALLMFTRRQDIMGAFANGRVTNIAAVAGTATVLLLNIVLIVQTLGIAIPGLPAAE